MLGLMPSAWGAADPENCEVDLTASLPSGIDWGSVHSVRSEDGRVWQRGIVSVPSAELILKEGGMVEIPALVKPQAEAMAFLFAPTQKSGDGLDPPGLGTCFSLPVADKSGQTSLTIAAPVLWQAMGGELAIDVFFAAEPDWAAYRERQATTSTLITAQNAVRRFVIKTDTDTEAETERQGKVIHRSGQLYGYSPQSLASAQDGMRDSAGLLSEPMPECNTLCEGALTEALRLESHLLPESLHGKSVTAIAGKSVVIGRMPGPHTYYAASLSGSDDIAEAVLHQVTRQAIMMEGLKRALLGYENYHGQAPGLEQLTPQTLDRVAHGMEAVSERTVLLTQQIALAMTNPAKRQASADAIAEILLNDHYQSNSGTGLKWDIARNFLDLLPAEPVDQRYWAEDFLTLLRFWTGSRHENLCLMLNDDQFTQNLQSVGLKGEYCGMRLVSGSTPKLVLRLPESVMVTPLLQGARITSANASFASGTESFLMAEGKKPLLDYRYFLTEPFFPRLLGEICVRPSDLTVLANRISGAYQLDAAEQAALLSELQLAVNDPLALTRLRIADPRDVAQVFRWAGNERPLRLLQLFFEAKPHGCERVTMNLPLLFPPHDRDGFEAGMLPSS